MNNLKPEQSPHLTEYYHILIKHKSLITASLAITVTLTLLFTFLMKPVFRATTTMVIEKEQSTSPLTGERLDYESYLSQSLTFNTHFKLITSRPILEKVIKDLKLDQLEREQGLAVGPLRNFLSRVGRNVRLLMGQGEKSLTPKEELARLVEKLKNKLAVEEVRDTRLLKVSVEDHDPVMARDIANSLARVYIEFNIANRLRSSQNTLSWMTDQLYEMKKRLEDAEEEFQVYKQQEKLFSIKGKQKVITQKIEDFNDAYLEARNKRLELDAKLAELGRSFQSEGDILHARFLIDNSVIDNLYTQLLDAEVEFSRLSKVFKSKHPKIIQVQSKIDKTRKNLNEELTKEMQNLKTERTVLFDKETILQKTIADFEKDALDTDKKELKYGILERNVKTNQKLYDTLLSKIKESDIVGNFDASNIRITEKGTIPLEPDRPKKTLNFVLSVIFGLMTGVGLAFFREYLDRSLRTEEDVQRYLDLSVLSVIPVAEDKEASELKAQGSTTDLIKPAKTSRQKQSNASSPLLMNSYPAKSRFAEAYRTLRTNILFSFMEKKLRSLLITSAGQDEGKTSAVANLAYTIAQTGQSVLMIDADLRKPTLTELIPSQESPGLTGLLSNLFSVDIRNGSLERWGISDLLRLLSLQKKTGLLRLSDEKEEVELFFFQGELVDLNWLTRPEGKKLAAVLINNGTLAEEHVASAIARQEDTGQKLGFILINMGLLKEDALKGPLTIHMMEGFRVALQMNKGVFSFNELPESDFDRSSFDPVDFRQLYKQMVLGGEELPYLQEKINSAILKTGVPNLFLLPSGNLPPNPSELLGSKRMSFLLSNLRKRFDVLIIDSAPILPASDALILAPEADGVLLIVKGGLMNRELVKKAVEQLRVARAHLLGVALNYVDIKREGYYKYYHKYYSQYYGENA